MGNQAEQLPALFRSSIPNNRKKSDYGDDSTTESVLSMTDNDDGPAIHDSEILHAHNKLRMRMVDSSATEDPDSDLCPNLHDSFDTNTEEEKV